MIEVKKLRKGDYIVHKDKPYRVRNIGTKVMGSHSHTITKIELESLLDGAKDTITKSSHERLEDLKIVRRLGQYISPAGGGRVQVMAMDDYEVFEAEVLPDVMGQLKQGGNLTFVEFKGKKIVLEVRD